MATLIVALCANGATPSPRDIAQAYFEIHRRPSDAADAWRRYMNPVKQQMVHLAREGVVEIIRKGVAVDPNDFRGLVRVRLAGAVSSVIGDGDSMDSFDYDNDSDGGGDGE